MSAPHLTHFPLFIESITLVFSRWTALQLALDHQMAGASTPLRATELLEDTAAFFRTHGSEVHADELDSNFTAFFEEVFCAELDDGSPLQVGRTLVKLYAEIVGEGRLELLEELRGKARVSGAGRSVRAGGDADDDDEESGDEEEGEGEAMDVDVPVVRERAPWPEPVVDEDGFELVQKKGRRRN
ncbi:hypothetical protein BDK51DRAFT_20976 [Blyttiomyces helicus]|uniref:Pre-rRNA-processing protein TSR2-domain-containing protein n=1 Tax=Blyttiomyces helicus TaxID=388810 RepID=A0A4P9WEN7_9FUNG|nr:hypothetical protein BDK51DRAFT_20976 [Blyttiomyces helicus]|eukprot:RKO91191.1 hypothetical protein BDK51DRAFT_20976 [Blyttiomyces helicus]